MRALRVVVVAFLTAIAGAVLSVVASQYLTELYHVSNFEGGRGMLIFFALAARSHCWLHHRTDRRSAASWNGIRRFARAQGIALGIAIGPTAIVSGILYLGADHPPKLDGKTLALEFELKIPPALRLPVQQS